MATVLINKGGLSGLPRVIEQVNKVCKFRRSHIDTAWTSIAIGDHFSMATLLDLFTKQIPESRLLLTAFVAPLDSSKPTSQVQVIFDQNEQHEIDIAVRGVQDRNNHMQKTPQCYESATQAIQAIARGSNPIIKHAIAARLLIDFRATLPAKGNKRDLNPWKLLHLTADEWPKFSHWPLAVHHFAAAIRSPTHQIVLGFDRASRVIEVTRDRGEMAGQLEDYLEAWLLGRTLGIQDRAYQPGINAQEFSSWQEDQKPIARGRGWVSAKTGARVH